MPIQFLFQGVYYFNMDRLRQKFSDISMPSGYNVSFTGQYQVIKRTVLDFAPIALAAIVLIYLIRAMQFRTIVT